VARYVFKNPAARRFMDQLKPLTEFLVDQFAQEGKSYLTVAVGCTGGRHRSVAMARALGDVIRRRGAEVRVIHRDVERRTRRA
jgi:UPF0042 nucleotide-binding protein